MHRLRLLTDLGGEGSYTRPECLGEFIQQCPPPLLRLPLGERALGFQLLAGDRVIAKDKDGVRPPANLVPFFRVRNRENVIETDSEQSFWWYVIGDLPPCGNGAARPPTAGTPAPAGARRRGFRPARERRCSPGRRPGW